MAGLCSRLLVEEGRGLLPLLLVRVHGWLVGVVSCCGWEHVRTRVGRCVGLCSASGHRLPRGGCARCRDWCIVFMHSCDSILVGVGSYRGTRGPAGSDVLLTLL